MTSGCEHDFYAPFPYLSFYSLDLCIMNLPISSFDNFEPQIPVGDDKERMVCKRCDWIHYENPRVILTGLCVWENQVLLCRRAIAPRYGFWTLPGGFMEVGETLEEGTCREVREEAGANVRVTSLLATYGIPRIGQVHMVYVAQMTSPDFSVGPESLDVALFPLTQEALPWDELAFPANHWALRDYLSLHGKTVGQPFTMTEEYLADRMSPIEYHPDFPPPLS
jgi:ADP-ribose pyrophosphatase YjhB (NUDIX family)